VVMIRITGLWGSSFSKAFEGKMPNPFSQLKKTLLMILQNGIFFLPKREVSIELEFLSKDLSHFEKKNDLNQFLENWFNRYPLPNHRIAREEPVQLVSKLFWKESFDSLYEFEEKNPKEFVAISETVRKEIFSEIRRILSAPLLEIHDKDRLAEDLRMDSLNIAELIAFLSQKYGLTKVEFEDLNTVLSVLGLAQEGALCKKNVLKHTHSGWIDTSTNMLPEPPSSRTIGESFLFCADKMGKQEASSDPIRGILRFSDLKKGALVLSSFFTRKKEKFIGVMLPASAASEVTIAALYLAKKVPVMLNWTLGSKPLTEMCKLAQVDQILTSRTFVNRLRELDLGDKNDSLIFLEDLRDSLSLWDKLKGVFLSKFSATTLKKLLKLDSVEPKDPAVILFTSGSEALPKGVPLSHENILSDLSSALNSIEFKSNDVVAGILPPFHSFGFLVGVVLPLTTGIKVAYYPDPTDSLALADLIAHWKVTIFVSAPSFLRGLLKVGTKTQLESVRWFIIGAEAPTQEIFDKVQALENGALVLEGYGITECSPILALTNPKGGSQGVGQFLDIVKTKTIHPETLKVLPPGEEGELCVSGPNVFYGYLGAIASPFIEIDGTVWYRTGDIGKITENGSFILSGRLKRFVKVGGEMISLSAVEGVFRSESYFQGELPTVAVCADESIKERPRLIFFTTKPYDLEQAHQALEKNGFSRIVKFHEIKQVPELPLMGAGKIDYRKIQQWI
jgi:long-chain-fatty-acid--[acyl-carrier-protein] ligase